MWVEVTASRWRSGRKPAAAALIASTAVAARTRAPRSVSIVTSPPGPLAIRLARVRSQMLDPRVERRRAQRPGEQRRLHGRGAGHERAGAKQRRVAARADLLGVDRARTARGRAELGAGAHRRHPGAVLGGAGGDLEVPGPAKADLQLSGRGRRRRSRRPSGRRARRSRARRRAPNRSRSRSTRCQKPFTKPALRPLGPSPQMPASSSTTRACGSRRAAPRRSRDRRSRRRRSRRRHAHRSSAGRCGSIGSASASQWPPAVVAEGRRDGEAVTRNIGTPFARIQRCPAPEIEIEVSVGGRSDAAGQGPAPGSDSPPDRSGLRRADPRDRARTAAVKAAATPEAATLELDGAIEVTHGVGDRAQVTATVDSRGRPDGAGDRRRGRAPRAGRVAGRAARSRAGPRGARPRPATGPRSSRCPAHPRRCSSSTSRPASASATDPARAPTRSRLRPSRCWRCSRAAAR